MKKLIFISFIVLIGTSNNIYAGTYGGGSGIEGDPYLISDPNHMHEIGADVGDWGSHFLLTNDIDLSRFSGTEFNIIGNDANSFTGVFDGGGYVINHFKYTSTGVNYIGIFSYIETGGIIKNLGMTNVDVDAGTGTVVAALAGSNVGDITNCYARGDVIGHAVVGGLVGANYGTISDCYAEGIVNVTDMGDDTVGGLAGYHNGGTISNCHAASNVMGGSYIGGLVGGVREGVILECYARSNVTATGWHVGGLVGISDYGTISYCYAIGEIRGGGWGGNDTAGLVGYLNFGTVSNCYSKGSVIGYRYAGGLIGTVGNTGELMFCYTTSTVSSVVSMGGMIGRDFAGSYTSCFWDSDINPDVNGIGDSSDPNVIAKSTAEMQTLSTFAGAGWDFGTPIWEYYTG